MQHDAVLARVLHLLDGQRGDPAGRPVAGGEGPEVDVGERVAADHQEGVITEELRTRPHPAGGSQQLGLVVVGQPLAEELPDRVREVVQVGDHLLEAVAVEQVEDVLHHGPVQHRHHRLGDLVGQGAQARAETGRQDHRSHRLESLVIAAAGAGANSGSGRA